MTTNSRRDFIKKTTDASVAVSVGAALPAFSAKSYGRILGANETLNVAVMGVNSRGKVLAKNLQSRKDAMYFISSLLSRLSFRRMAMNLV